MRDLHVIDCSATAHGGDKGRFKASNFYGFPTGAIFNTFKSIDKKAVDLTQDVVAFCFDRHSPIKDLDATYKSNRQSWSTRMYLQIKLLEEMLPKMGFQTFVQEETEADWLIISLVLKYRHLFRHVYIYGTDRDLACVVGPNVTFISTHQYVPTVTYKNYEEVLSKENWTPYNSVLLSKVFRGDKSDVIKKVVTPDQYNTLIHQLKQVNFPIHQLGDLKAVEYVIEHYNCPQEIKDRLWKNWAKIQYVYWDLELNTNPEYNLEIIKTYCNALSLTRLGKKFNLNLDFSIPQKWETQLNVLSQLCFENSLERNEQIIIDKVSEYCNSPALEHMFQNGTPNIWTILENRHIKLVDDILVKYEFPEPYIPSDTPRIINQLPPTCEMLESFILQGEEIPMDTNIVFANENILLNHEIDNFKHNQTFCKLFNENSQLTLRCTYLDSPIDGVNYYPQSYGLGLEDDSTHYPTLIVYFESLKTGEVLAQEPLLYIPTTMQELEKTMTLLFSNFTV